MLVSISTKSDILNLCQISAYKSGKYMIKVIVKILLINYLITTTFSFLLRLIITIKKGVEFY